MVYELEPKYTVRKGVYNLDVMYRTTPISAREADKFSLLFRGIRLSDTWSYEYMPLNKVDGFIATLSKYAYYDPDFIYGKVFEGEIPAEDLIELSEMFDVAYHMNTINDSKMKEVAEKVKRDVDRLNRLLDEMTKTGKYWPPIVAEDYEPLDGSHRVCAIRALNGPDYKIFMWREMVAQQPIVEKKTTLKLCSRNR